MTEVWTRGDALNSSELFCSLHFYELFYLNVPLILKRDILVDCADNCVREFIFILTNDIH